MSLKKALDKADEATDTLTIAIGDTYRLYEKDRQFYLEMYNSSSSTDKLEFRASQESVLMHMPPTMIWHIVDAWKAYILERSKSHEGKFTRLMVGRP